MAAPFVAPLMTVMTLFESELPVTSVNVQLFTVVEPVCAELFVSVSVPVPTLTMATFVPGFESTNVPPKVVLKFNAPI